MVHKIELMSKKSVQMVFILELLIASQMSRMAFRLHRVVNGCSNNDA